MTRPYKVDVQPEPGDLCVVNTGGRYTHMIEAMQFISGRGKSEFDHALMCVGRPDDGTILIGEAQPGGAVVRPWHYEGRPHRWSTGILPPCPKAADAAYGYAGYELQNGTWVKVRDGVGYSDLDYVAIAARSAHIPAPGLREYIKATGHMICSQYCGASRLGGGCPLYSYWTGYIEPMDLAHLMGQ